MKIKKIIDADISIVSLVNKGANGEDFLIIKNEQGLNVEIDVPILKTDDEKMLVTGIVYEPNKIDSQGECMTAEAIEKASYAFMEKYQQVDKNHDLQIDKNLIIVENFIAKSDMKIENKEIKKGTWLMTTKVNDKDTWEAIKKGKIKGYSMYGKGKKIEVEEENKIKKEDNEMSTEVKEAVGFFNAIKKAFGLDTPSKKDDPIIENINIEEESEVNKKEYDALNEKIDKITKSFEELMNEKPKENEEVEIIKSEEAKVIDAKIDKLADMVEKIAKSNTQISKQMEDTEIHKSDEGFFKSIDI